MSLSLSRIIYYVRDVGLLKAFYVNHFGLTLVEEIEGEWALLRAGAMELALHRAGVALKSVGPNDATASQVKIVFSVTSDLADIRERMNVFQLSQSD